MNKLRISRAVVIGAVFAVAQIVIAGVFFSRVAQDPSPQAVPKGRWDAHLWDAWKAFPVSLLVVAIVVGVGLALFGRYVQRGLDRVPRLAFDVAIAVVAFYLVKLAGERAFSFTPQLQDEIAYDLLARRIAHGTPVPASDPMGEFGRIRFLVDDGRNYPLFQPGWPAFLAIFYFFKSPHAGPAAASALFVVFSSRLADRLYGRIAGVLTALVLLVSAWVRVMGSTSFAHAFAAALVVASLERLVAALDGKNSARWSLVAGISAGLFAAWLFITRMANAAALGPSVLVAIVLFAWEPPDPNAVRPAWSKLESAKVAWSWLKPRLPRLRARARKPLLAFAIACTLGPLAQMGWDLATTRNALELPQDRWFGLTESNPSCHRLGFGDDIGCRREHGPDLPPGGGFTPARAMEVDKIRWASFRNDGWGSAIAIGLAGIFLLRRMRAKDAIVVGAAVVPILVYHLFYYHALAFGTRLWFEVMGPLAVIIGAGIADPFSESPKLRELAPLTRVRSIASIAALAIFSAVARDEIKRDIPDRIGASSHMHQAETVMKNVEASHVPHHAIVYLMNCIEPDRADLVLGWASVNNATPPENGDRWFVRDYDVEHDRQFVTMHPDWAHYRANCGGTALGPLPPPRPELVVTESEAKFPPDARPHAYGVLEPFPGAGWNAVLAMTFQAPDGLLRFRQWLFVDGDYDLSMRYARRLDGGRWSLAIDGVVIDPPVDGRGDHGLFDWKASAPVHLAKGLHTLEYRNAESYGTFHDAVDRVIFSLRAAPAP